MTLPPPLRRDLQPARGRVYSGVALLDALRGRESLGCVGDVVSSYCVRASPRRLVAVVDGRTRRGPLARSEAGFTSGGWDLVLRVSNPPGRLPCRGLNSMLAIQDGSRLGSRLSRRRGRPAGCPVDGVR